MGRSSGNGFRKHQSLDCQSWLFEQPFGRSMLNAFKVTRILRQVKEIVNAFNLYPIEVCNSLKRLANDFQAIFPAPQSSSKRNTRTVSRRPQRARETQIGRLPIRAIRSKVLVISKIELGASWPAGCFKHRRNQTAFGESIGKR